MHDACSPVTTHDESQRFLPAPVIHVAVLGIYLLLAVPLIRDGLFSGDEGWYLLASINVFEGQKPYRDFLFTQTPFLPYVYGLLLSPLDATVGAGRWLSLGFGAGALLATVELCRRRAGAVAAMVAGGLLAMNLSFVSDVVSVRTQASTLFWMATSLLLVGGRRSTGAVLASLLFMNLAVLTRLSVLPVLVCLWVHLALANLLPRRLLAGAVLTNLALAAAIFWFFDSDGNLLFGIYGFHAEYFGNPKLGLEMIRYFTTGVLANQLVILMLFTWLSIDALWRWSRDAFRPVRLGGEPLFEAFLLCGALAMTAIHISRPVSYATYQTSTLALVVTFCALRVTPKILALERAGRIAAAAAMICLLALSTRFQEYIRMPDARGTPEQIVETAATIETLTIEGDALLTLSPELSISSGRALLPGYELGQFSYFASMDPERARKLRVVNRRRLRQDIREQRAALVALTERDFLFLTQGSPHRLQKLLGEFYEHRASVDGYGQFLDTLHLYASKTPRRDRSSDRSRE